MRNLKVTCCKVLPANELIAQAQCFCLGCDLGTVWIASQNELCCIESNKVSSVVPLMDHMMSSDRVAGIEYLSESESVCLALCGGNILLYNVATSELDSVGEIEVGVVCMGWSPDQDIVVMVTGEHKLVLMTKDFDVLTETFIHQKDFGEAKPVTVGWGKKETQFHGSQGKPNISQLQEKVAQPALPWDDRQTRISWRGDGEFFACSAIDPSSGCRCIRVWSRDCVLHSTCETIDGLEQSLAWKPSGRLLASTQLKPNRNDVVFFERNGLRHGEFSFQTPPTNIRVRELLWSNDSAVLGVWCVQGEGEEEWVQLWTVGNYHWYLKQDIRLPRSKVKKSSSTSLVGLLWDPIIPLKLHLLTSEGQYLSYMWCWIVSESKSHSEANSSGVAVIDGCQVLYTPFRYSIIPPPMSACKLLLPAPINELAFAPPPQSNDFLALLSNFKLAVFSFFGKETEDSTKVKGVVIHRAPELVGMASVFEELDGFHSLRQLVWWRPNSLLAVAMGDKGRELEYSETILKLGLIVDRENKSVQITKDCSVLVPGSVLSLCANPDTGTAVVQLTSGKVMKYSMLDSEKYDLSPWQLDSGSNLNFGEQLCCEKIELALFNGKERVIGLCEPRCSLFVDDLKVASGCTSFAVHDEFLLFTTNYHICLFISLQSDPKALPPLDPGKPRTLDENVRRVERGSKIVTVIPADTRLILQMPRGNLETIWPRTLILSDVRKKLDRLEFGSAFRNMREHRINLNLIYDHNPKAFLSNIPKFIQQLDSVNYINLFLTELREEDVCKTMYPNSNMDKSQDSGGGGGKVDRVCEAMRDVLVEMGEKAYLLSIITTHVKMTKPEVETVLNMIQKLKESQSKGQKSLKPGDSVGAEEALKYTMFLVDVNELYDVALGMYDLPLVVMVAEKSQKDPKEYLPFLNELNKLPLDYRHYKIDVHLKRYRKALQHISKCSDKFEESLILIKAQSLYKEALMIYTDRSSDEYKTVAREYGQHLSDVGKHKDAGIIFSQCGCHREALDAFEKASCWQQVFVASSLLGHTVPERMELARRVGRSLQSNRCYLESCRVLLDYADDVEEAVVVLLEGSYWEEALRQLYLHNRLDLLETNVLPALLEARESRLTLFTNLHSDFKHHSSRLAIVRETKKLRQAAIFDKTYADEKDADLFSDTSSVTATISSLNTSLHSKTSGRSSKNKRKAKRKKLSLREGGLHEEEALVSALGEIVSTVDSLQEDVGSLLTVLVQFGCTNEARSVQKSFSELLEMIQSSIEMVWTSAPTSTNVQLHMGPDATVNSIMAAMNASQQASISVAGPSPRLRNNVQWKLASL